MLLADLVACADAVAATSARTAKIESLAELLRGAAGREAGVVAGLVAGGVALRFARVVRYRNDKPASDTDTIAEIRSLLPGSPGSIGSRP